MTDRDCYDAMRIKALALARTAAGHLDAKGAADGKLAPHVALERIADLRRVARQINALADFVEALK